MYQAFLRQGADAAVAASGRAVQKKDAVRPHIERIIAAVDVKAIRKAQRMLGVPALVVTRGRNGMAVAQGAKTTLLPAHGSQELVDVTGAGDTVGAALTLALAAGASVEDAARLANVAGALKVQKTGTASVSVVELAREVLPASGRRGAGAK